jgi:DNA-binding response OmpR family regulator
MRVNLYEIFKSFCYTGCAVLPGIIQSGRYGRSMSRTILVVDDDRKTVELIRLYLERDGYQVGVAYDGRQALETAMRIHPDLIILDLMLPKVDGLDVCRILRQETDIPIIMLTAKTTEEDKLLGLDLGADDYVSKPFSPRELMARMRAVLRRSAEKKHTGPERIECEALKVDFSRRQVTLFGELVHLTPKEFHLLEILIRQPERVFTRLDLLKGAFGYDFGGLERNVDVHIMNLRKKIEPNPEEPHFVQTVYGMGYKFGGVTVTSEKLGHGNKVNDVP